MLIVTSQNKLENRSFSWQAKRFHSMVMDQAGWTIERDANARSSRNVGVQYCIWQCGCIVCRAREQSVCVARRPDAVSAPLNVGPDDELSYATTSFSSNGALVIRGRRNQFEGGDYHAKGSYKARRVISHRCVSWAVQSTKIALKQREIRPLRRGRVMTTMSMQQ